MSCDGAYLATCSDRGTTHLFNISTGLATSQTAQPAKQSDSVVSGSSASAEEAKSGASGLKSQNTFSKLYYVGSLLSSYYSREFSFSQLRAKDAD